MIWQLTLLKTTLLLSSTVAVLSTLPPFSCSITFWFIIEYLKWAKTKLHLLRKPWRTTSLHLPPRMLSSVTHTCRIQHSRSAIRIQRNSKPTLSSSPSSCNPPPMRTTTEPQGGDVVESHLSSTKWLLYMKPVKYNLIWIELSRSVPFRPPFFNSLI